MPPSVATYSVAFIARSATVAMRTKNIYLFNVDSINIVAKITKYIFEEKLCACNEWRHRTHFPHELNVRKSFSMLMKRNNISIRNQIQKQNSILNNMHVTQKAYGFFRSIAKSQQMLINFELQIWHSESKANGWLGSLPLLNQDYQNFSWKYQKW